MIVTSALFVVLAAAPAHFQEPQAEPPRIELKLDSKAAPMGGIVKGRVFVTFSPGWHGYQNPPMRDYEIPLKVEGATKDLKLKATYPKGELKDFAGAKTLMYEGTVAVPFTLLVPKKKGTFKFDLNVSYQQCNHATCLPPESQKVSGSIAVTAARKPAAPPKPAKPPIP